MIDVVAASAAMGLAVTSSFLRGFQNKNIVAGFKGLTFSTGFVMGTLDVMAITLVAKTGLELAVFYGMGMGMGYLLSIYVHEQMTKRKELERKQLKKTKTAERTEAIVLEVLRDYDLIGDKKQEKE